MSKVTITVPDPQLTVQTLLSANWSNGNTNSRTPKFVTGTTKGLDLNVSDEVRIYITSMTSDDEGVSGAHLTRTDRVSIDCRTKKDRSHMFKMMSEVERILASNRITPSTLPSGAQYDLIKAGNWVNPVEWPDFWQMVLDVTLLGIWEAKS